MQIRIEKYTLYDFVTEIEKAVKAGYSINHTDNDSIPVGSSGWYRCVLHKDTNVAALLKPVVVQPLPVIEPYKTVDAIATQPIKPFVPSVTFEVETPVARKAGRPAKERI